MLERRDRDTEAEQINTLVKMTGGTTTSSSQYSSIANPTIPTKSGTRTGRWTPEEKLLFLYGLRRFGKGRWKKMSIYLPNRSLVQIKSHAQKVLKRLDAGENVFQRLEENDGLVDSLVSQATKQQQNGDSTSSPPATISNTLTKDAKKTTAARKRKRVVALKNRSQPSQQGVSIFSTDNRSAVDNNNSFTTSSSSSCCRDTDVARSIESDTMTTTQESVIAAAALCQLSSLGGGWEASKLNNASRQQKTC